MSLKSARGRGCPAAGSQESYRVSNRSKRSSRVPSPRTAWKPSSGSFVFRDLHANATAAPADGSLALGLCAVTRFRPKRLYLENERRLSVAPPAYSADGTAEHERYSSSGYLGVIGRGGTAIGRNTQNTKPAELTFRVVLGDGARELRFERLLAR